jgi:hypothetical protein
MHVHTTVFACSDAHSLAELGRVRTRFQERVETREQLVRALQRGACAPEPAGGDLARAALGYFSSRGESSASRGDQHRRRGP